MKMVKISEIFEVKYGVNLELVNLEECEKGDEFSINFVSRTEKNNGVSAYVRKIPDVNPNPANTLSVAGGGSVLSTFYQKEEYYSGRDIYVLIPKKKYSEIELLFYAFCIRQNKYRYNYGRQANKTLKSILIPEVTPKEWQSLSLKKVSKLNSGSIKKQIPSLTTDKWGSYYLADLFNIEKGERLNKEDRISGSIPLVTSKDENLGVSEFIDLESYMYDKKTFSDSISVDMFGNTFYHSGKYFGDDNVHPLVWKEEYQKNTNKYVNLFIVAVFQKLKIKYSYGRQVRIERLKYESIKLPSRNKNPDWQFMENYIKSLPYSASI